MTEEIWQAMTGMMPPEAFRSHAGQPSWVVMHRMAQENPDLFAEELPPWAEPGRHVKTLVDERSLSIVIEKYSLWD